MKRKGFDTYADAVVGANVECVHNTRTVSVGFAKIHEKNNYAYEHVLRQDIKRSTGERVANSWHFHEF